MFSFRLGGRFSRGWLGASTISEAGQPSGECRLKGDSKGCGGGSGPRCLPKRSGARDGSRLVLASWCIGRILSVVICDIIGVPNTVSYAETSSFSLYGGIYNSFVEAHKN